MKIFKSILFLLFISFQADASGYTHNMFVAHKKMQAVSETLTESVKPLEEETKDKTQMNPNTISIAEQLSDQLAGFSTLNQRILNESRISFFDSEEEESTGNTIIGALINSLQKMVFMLLGIRK